MQKELEIIPAILVQSREQLIEAIERVKPYVKTVQLDIMDNKFVPNKTIGIESLYNLPAGVKYEFHWMVQHPEESIKQLKGSHLHIVHVEAEMNWEKVKATVSKNGGKLGIAFNPETPLERVYKYENEINYVLAMTVHPGFSGQSYIKDVETKIKDLRKKHPEFDIEVDGGINLHTISRAVKAGANKLVAASAIFSSPDAGKAIEELRRVALA